MEKNERVQYWLKSADDDWKAALHLFDTRDYTHSLFFAHLTIEKILKAIYTHILNETPPFTHRLLPIAEKTSIEFSDSQIELLEIISDFNMEARYPDEKFSFRKKCTKKFTKKYLELIKELSLWLIRKIQ